MGIVDQIRDAGIVGCGGAGFPTHKKLNPGIEYLIINGAECEPLLRTDRYIMLNKAPDMVRALTALQAELELELHVVASVGGKAGGGFNIGSAAGSQNRHSEQAKTHHRQQYSGNTPGHRAPPFLNRRLSVLEFLKLC